LQPTATLWHDSLHVTCGLTACTPGSAPGPTLGNEYGKTLPFTLPQFAEVFLAISPTVWNGLALEMRLFFADDTFTCCVKCFVSHSHLLPQSILYRLYLNVTVCVIVDINVVIVIIISSC